MFQCLIQFRDGQSVLPPSGLRLHTPHDSFKAIREVFLQPTHTVLKSHYSPIYFKFTSPIQLSVFFFCCTTIYCPFVLMTIFNLASSLLIPSFSFPFSANIVSAVCIKRPVIHHRVRAECSPCCTPVCRLLVCQPSRS